MQSTGKSPRTLRRCPVCSRDVSWLRAIVSQAGPSITCPGCSTVIGAEESRVVAAIVAGVNTLLVFAVVIAYFCCGPLSAGLVLFAMFALTFIPLHGRLVVVDEAFRKRRLAGWVVGALFIVFLALLIFSVVY